jgi:sugar transferase EpsL
MKRLFDFLFSLILLILLFPIIVIIGFIVWWKIGSPILFVQRRPGLHEKLFTLYKFRTMNNKKDASGKLLIDDIRLTSVGRLLRKYSLDEIPQLVNVLKGDLSLVGPRPLLIEYLPLYSEEQRNRHNVRPGITGWAQVNGRNAISWEEKFELDLWYVNNRSFYLDIKILFFTIYKVLKSEGINQSDNTTMEVFSGSNSSLKEGHG